MCIDGLTCHEYKVNVCCGNDVLAEEEKQKLNKSRLLKRQGASEKSHFVQRGPGALGVSERSGARLIYGPWPLMDAATVNEETPTGPA